MIEKQTEGSARGVSDAQSHSLLGWTEENNE
jgi:hypothetical protein